MSDRSELAEAYAQMHPIHCICFGKGYYRVNFPVSDPLFGCAIPCICRKDAVEKQRAARLIKKSGITSFEFDRWDFNEFKPSDCMFLTEDYEPVLLQIQTIKTACVRYGQNPKYWLILQGGSGSGKTHLAYAIAKSAIIHNRSVFCHSVTNLLDLLRSSYNDGTYDLLIKDLCTVDLLVLDDLGAEKETEWAVEKLYQIINERSQKLLPLVITTNLKIDDPNCRMDFRVLTRLRDGLKSGREGLVHILNLNVGDYRPVNRAFHAQKASLLPYGEKSVQA